MMLQRRQLWLYPLFQIPLMLMIGCLIIAVLGWLLSWGRPPVAVAISLDLSGSTTGYVRQQEILAIKSYLQQNEALKNPNEIKILAFASNVQPLTTSFNSKTQEVDNELTQALQNPSLEKQLGGGTNLNLAIQEGVNSLKTILKHCRELLIVTDGIVDVNPEIVDQAIKENVKINAVVLGNIVSSDLQTATIRSRGIYLSGEASQLSTLFTENLFTRFNSNLRWIIFWLGAAFICLMWMLTLPLDRWLFQGLIGLDMTLSGQLALGNALFWTILTIIVVWRLFGLPFTGAC
ncbi:VWA domain-containing protein [Planktothricoides sp. FACHB-1370]|uniref:VWA domain-containing protein n=2 Tax=Planktothricoides raciborskii TaxID=132608 RepID=A0ABR8EFT7_9CYAN|nr:VWA domain-containing protein [Planktothricoides raciborskii FACHB-1370]MBD2584368.1 VWA domain-containing protein [Planktothricoides raciborskii FACHB-1261]